MNTDTTKPTEKVNTQQPEKTASNPVDPKIAGNSVQSPSHDKTAPPAQRSDALQAKKN